MFLERALDQFYRANLIAKVNYGRLLYFRDAVALSSSRRHVRSPPPTSPFASNVRR